MKKVFLSIALVAGMAVATNVHAVNTLNENSSPSVLMMAEEDGFVDVQFDELNEKVQDAVRVIDQDYELNVLQYNAEKQLTKVGATKKDDQSKRVFYLDNEGKEITLEPVENVQQESMEQQETPSPESLYVAQDDGFVEVKIEELGDKVQASVNALNESYEIVTILFNAEKQVTKVKTIKRDDQTEKEFLFDGEGNEIAEVEAAEQQTEVQEEAPSPESFATQIYTAQDDGFVDVKIEDLNANVQAAINTLSETYEIDSLKYNAEKQITKVDATSKDDQSKRTIYLDNEGVETTLDQAAEAVEEVM